MIKGVIFDMDGTLVDNSPIHEQAFEIWCKTRGFSFTHSDLEKLFGMGNDDILKFVTGDPNLTDETIDLYAQEKEATYRELYAPTIKPIAGLLDLLSELEAQGVKMAIGSSGMRKNVDFVLEKCGIERYFSALANGDLVKKAKPDPAIFLLAAQMLGLQPQECVVIEDSFAGIEAARRAGMKVVAITTSFEASRHKDFDILIDDFTQIKAEDILAL